MVHQNAVLEVPLYGPPEHRTFNEATNALQIIHFVAVIDTVHILLDDGPGIQFSGDVMSRGPNQFDTAIVGSSIRVLPHEGRQKRVMNVDDAVGVVLHKIGRQDLHVSCQHDQVHVSRQNPHLLRFRVRLLRGVDRHVKERDAERCRRFRGVRMIADNRHNIGKQVANLPLPQQFEQTMLLFGHENRNPLRSGRQTQFPIHLEARGQGRKIRSQSFDLTRQVRQIELHTHKKQALIGMSGMLIGLHNIGPMTV
ncbi:MAG: hypothetical protein A2201_06470 [Alicyclobacillus sp. RIFOXYA1_FULL_53_8]|nr:MAG: hypothetical protein A2201_06470 [Alicyclobacillus sp. RIFOXYA1_FULL_53_8]